LNGGTLYFLCSNTNKLIIGVGGIRVNDPIIEKYTFIRNTSKSSILKKGIHLFENGGRAPHSLHERRALKSQSAPRSSFDPKETDMSYILYNPATLSPDILSKLRNSLNPTLDSSLDSTLDPSLDPELASALIYLSSIEKVICPVCRKTMYKNGKSTKECNETDSIGNDCKFSLELSRIKCKSERCYVELKYFQDTYPGSTMKPSEYFKTVGETALLLGLESAAEIFNLDEMVVKKAVNLFCTDLIKPNQDDTLAFHMIETSEQKYLIVIDVDKKMIVDVQKKPSIQQSIRSALDTFNTIKRIIIPNDEKIMECINSTGRNSLVVTVERTKGSYTKKLMIEDIDMKTIVSAHNKVIKFLHANPKSTLKELSGLKGYL